MGDISTWILPKHEVPAIYEYIMSSVKSFVPCPYGLCWYEDGYTYFATFWVRFFGCYHAECTFKKPYEYPVEYEGYGDDPEEEVDPEELRRRMGDDFKEIQYMFCRLIVTSTKHRHTDIQCDCDAGNIYVTLCNITHGNDDEASTLEVYKKLVDNVKTKKPYVNQCLAIDTSNLKRMSSIEAQFLINLVYPFIEGDDPDGFMKNQRLGKIHIDLIRNNPVVIDTRGYGRFGGCIKSIEGEYEIDYRGMDWEAPVRIEMINRGIMRDCEFSDDE